MNRVRNLGISLILILGCGGKTDAPIDSSSEVGTGDGSSGADAGSAGSTTAADTTSTDTGGGFELVPARGISITEIEANQGTKIRIGLASDWVDGPGRNGQLVKQRDTLFRVHHIVEPGWVPRLVEARLDIGRSDGTAQVLTQRILIEGDSQERSLDSGFYFGLNSAEGTTEPLTTYQVSLWDVEPGGEAFSEANNVNPLSGPQQIGFENTDMAIKVVWVPITYQGVTPDVNQAAQDTIVRELYENNPVIRIESTWHSPVSYSGTLNDPGPLLSVMQNLRNQENAPSNNYYAAIVDMGSVTGSYVAGIANLGGNVSANRYTDSWPGIAGTITHEIGHNQGLSHIFCPGQSSAGPDPSYPYEDGHIGVTGFGIQSFQLLAADLSFDYMSYCGPSWVSDWTWRKTWPVISQFTAQGFVVPTAPSLQIALYPDGSEEYWTHPARVRPERMSGNHTVTFESPSGDEVIEVPAQYEVLSDDRTVWLTAPLPHDGAIDFDEWSVSYERTGEVHSIDASQIRIP